MKVNFSFKTDAEAYEYCLSILNTMIELFGISQEEALGRMNRRWGHLELGGEEELIYHELEDFWAKDIYYGHDSDWWLEPDDLKPLPYP